MTFEEWLGDRPKEFWAKALADKLAEAFQAGRVEGWTQGKRLSAHQNRISTNRTLDRISWE